MIEDGTFLVWNEERGETEEDGWVTKAWDAEWAASQWVEDYIDNGNLEGETEFTLMVKDSEGTIVKVHCSIDWDPNVYARIVD